jgi:hypothetical protein
MSLDLGYPAEIEERIRTKLSVVRVSTEDSQRIVGVEIPVLPFMTMGRPSEAIEKALACDPREILASYRKGKKLSLLVD